MPLPLPLPAKPPSQRPWREQHPRRKQRLCRTQRLYRKQVTEQRTPGPAAPARKSAIKALHCLDLRQCSAGARKLPHDLLISA
jgi:hypothetical protein